MRFWLLISTHPSLFYCHPSGVRPHKKVITDSSNPAFQNVKARISPASGSLTSFAANTLHQDCWKFNFCMMFSTK